MFLTKYTYYLNGKGKEDKRGRACGTCVSDKNIMQNFGRKTEGNRAPGVGGLGIGEENVTDTGLK